MKKALLWIFIIIVVIFSIGYILTAIFAKSFIEKMIQKQIDVKTEISSVSLGLPLNLQINGLVLENLAKVEKIKIAPSIIGLLSGKTILNSITLIKPDITLERKKDGSFNIPLPKKENDTKLIIAGLIIKDGTITLFDNKVTQGSFSFAIKDIDIQIKKASPLPYPLKIKYKLSGAIPSRPAVKEATVSGEGLIDITNKNMQGNFNISGIDAVFFRPYFKRFIPKDDEIEGAYVDFNADLTAKDNDLLIKCQLAIKNIPSKKETTTAQTEQPPSLSLDFTPLDLFKNQQGETVVNFKIKTKLDKPRLSISYLKAEIFQDAIKNILQNPEKVKNIIKDISDRFKNKNTDLEGEFKSFRDKLKSVIEE
ncbi:MAG TPA: DUF748 domain-containing protein [Candidatus Omnitrophica bacterium]|nr:DUF748 domain-containing protein [Candidatus Omnitrophota bacterium]